MHNIQPVAQICGKTRLFGPVLLALAALVLGSVAQAQVPVSITVSTVTNYIGTFTGVRLPHGVSADEGLGGFQVDITSISGTSVNLAPHATFCTELGETISATSYNNFQVVPLQFASAGTAGEPGTPSASIPVGGIGLQSAAQMRYLFDVYYKFENLSSWSIMEAQAFQLAVWEIGHDPQNLTITTDGGGVFYVPSQSSSTRNQAIARAQVMLDDVRAANVQIGYESQFVDVWSLAQDGSPGAQDILFATFKVSQDGHTVAPLLPAPIPEPAAAALTVFGAMALFRRRRRAA
jgi:hypothetical protein